MFGKKESIVYNYDRKIEKLIGEARDFGVSIRPYKKEDEVGILITDGKETVFKPIGDKYIITQ